MRAAASATCHRQSCGHEVVHRHPQGVGKFAQGVEGAGPARRFDVRDLDAMDAGRTCQSGLRQPAVLAPDRTGGSRSINRPAMSRGTSSSMPASIFACTARAAWRSARSASIAHRRSYAALEIVTVSVASSLRVGAAAGCDVQDLEEFSITHDDTPIADTKPEQI